MGINDVQKENVIRYRDLNNNDCPICNNNFDSMRGLQNHTGMVHNKYIRAILKCQNCKNEIIMNPGKARVRNWKIKHCNKCRSDWIKENYSGKNSPRYNSEKRKCVYCNNEIKVNKSRIKKQDNYFCNQECYHNWRHEAYEADREIFVEETGHKVRSEWEKCVDIILYNSDLSYEYEPEKFKFWGRTNNYIPDFIVEEKYVIEVKGYPRNKGIQQAILFNTVYPQYKYLVIQNLNSAHEKLMADKHVQYNAMQTKIVEAIQNER